MRSRGRRVRRSLDTAREWVGQPRSRARFVWHLTILALALQGYGGSLRGQTFVQLTDMGSNVGPRLTRVVSQARIGRKLFARIGTKVSYIDSGTVYQLATDPEWARILVGQWGQYVHGFANAGGPGGALGEVEGLDISARGTTYAADRSKARILVATFTRTAQNLTNPRNWGGPFPSPIDVAWDGQIAPLTTDYLYVLDDSLNSVSYWNLSSGPPGTLIWSYGTTGSGTGQFRRPTGVCVGKTAAANGGTQFTTSFYIADRGNKRLIQLDRTQTTATWVRTISIAGWEPIDCAVDHFGNVYVVDRVQHHIHKFTSSLDLLASYGSFGKGPNNYNTFAWPHAISVPCGLKVVNGVTVWYCEGRVVTAEQWGDSSGAVEHYLGIDGAVTAQPQTDQYGDAWFSFRTTEHAYHTFTVFDVSGNTVRRVPPMGIFPPGTRTWLWDGLRDDGTPAPSGTYWMQVTANSPYGCAGQTWCQKGLSTQTFFHQQGNNCGSGPCTPPVAEDVSDSASAPSTLFLRQRVVGAPTPLTRLSGPADRTGAVTTTSSGSLTAAVRQYGVRGLSIGVPRDASGRQVSVRVYSLAGRPIRMMVNEILQPGYYALAWDGMDDRGQAAAPGVYFAVLTAGGQRVVQRLILR